MVSASPSENGSRPASAVAPAPSLPVSASWMGASHSQFVRVGEALGATELPDTKAAVDAYLPEHVELMGVTMPTVAFLAGLAGAPRRGARSRGIRYGAGPLREVTDARARVAKSGTS